VDESEDEAESTAGFYQIDLNDPDLTCIPTHPYVDVQVASKSPICKSLFSRGDHTLYFPKDGEKGLLVRGIYGSLSTTQGPRKIFEMENEHWWAFGSSA
jgi:hypothetical protein